MKYIDWTSVDVKDFQLRYGKNNSTIDCAFKDQDGLSTFILVNLFSSKNIIIIILDIL